MSPCDTLLQPDGDPGDVIVILQQMDHATFERKGVDLFVKKKISLKQALCGFSFPFEHLDGKKLIIACSPGEVISPGGFNGTIHRAVTISFVEKLTIEHNYL